ncbi:pirin family protein [Paramicrobacterium fandaimingii]|uniref:pirin family protein n=1 Tax=Paramicrobacterium fandaimingii TaxID=2708079 RepID=UPI00141E9494|nr:pirin family protein [Microbacterium fandaimingii]
MTRFDAPTEELLVREVASPGPMTLLLESREVPLGGIRGITVHRSLPQRGLPTVGAWCFLDYFDEAGVPMRVLPHPHIGLQTVTWPLNGEIRHRDTVLSDVMIQPGQLNIMTSGYGIAHSEFSTEPDAASAALRGVQLWVALPSGAADHEPFFEQHSDLPVWQQGGVSARVFVGTLGSATSPATTFTPLLGAEMRLAAGTAESIPVDRTFEHAVFVLDGEVTVDDVRVTERQLLYIGDGCPSVEIVADAAAHVIFIGGEPFGEDLVMWWNFVGRAHDDIVRAREDWEARASRFGNVPGHGAERIPAPPLPTVTLTPRRRRR